MMAQNSFQGEGGHDGLSMGVVTEALAKKATVDMCDELTANKANKVDLEMCMRWVDMLHRMCKSLATLHTLNFKNALDVKG